MNLYPDDEPEEVDGEFIVDEGELKMTIFFNWVITIMLGLAVLMFLHRGIKNYSIYAQAYDRSVAVSGNAKANNYNDDVEFFYLRVKTTAENFPAISSKTIEKEKEKNLEQWVHVSPRVYDAVKAGDYITVEYAERKGQLYVRYADNRMPDWFYFIISFLCFLFLRHVRGWEFPMQYFHPRKYP